MTLKTKLKMKTTHISLAKLEQKVETARNWIMDLCLYILYIQQKKILLATRTLGVQVQVRGTKCNKTAAFN